MWQPEYVRRLGWTSDTFTKGKIYKIEGKYIVNDRGKQSRPSLDYTHETNGKYWEKVSKEEYDVINRIEPVFTYPKLPSELSLEEWVEAREKEFVLRMESKTENKSENKSEEIKMLKIEKVTLINGKRADKMSVSDFLQVVRDEQALISNLSILTKKCLTNIRLKSKALSNIKAIEALMDANLPDEGEK